MKSAVEIEVFFDFICPWCLIGKRQLQAAIELLHQTHQDVQVQIKWRGIQLLSAIPLDGVPFKAFYLQRLGSPTAVRLRQGQVRQAAKAIGVEIDFDKIPRMPNTAKAHYFFSKASALGDAEKHNLLLEAIFSAYFHHSENISDPLVLEKIAVQCGYQAAAIQAILDIPPTPFISADTGGKGVPYFVFDGSFAIAGAQPADVLYQAILEVLQTQEVENEQPL